VNAAHNNGSRALDSCSRFWARVSCQATSGAKVNAAANNGSRALDAAARNGNELVARLLLDHGAEFKAAAKNGLAALHVAALYGHESVIKPLLDQNAEVKYAENYVDFCDNYGETALSLVAAAGHLGRRQSTY